MRGREDRPQTLKQAKAAFKARGSTSVSDAEIRRLERSALLFERASRLKEQEQRRKDLARKREEKGLKEQQIGKTPLLGTQRKLDKFGYKSSQFHLGAFLKGARPSIATEQKKPGSPEPWDNDDEDIDDDALLDIADESSHQHAKHDADESGACQSLTTAGTLSDTDPASSTDEYAEEWDGFLEDNTQLARELSNEKPASQKQPALQFSSFGSTDFDISADDFEALEASLQEKQPAQSDDTSKEAELPPAKSVDRESMFRKLMPPPALPTLSKSHKPRAVTEQSTNLAPSGRLSTKATAKAFERSTFGISLADLESIAEEDIQLSQYHGG